MMMLNYHIDVVCYHSSGLCIFLADIKSLIKKNRESTDREKEMKSVFFIFYIFNIFFIYMPSAFTLLMHLACRLGTP